ncbi:MAG TPA: tripartite tricarboxylate transporter substrate-binding protein, partial [Deinococcales bacterium]|nr:tripartite tricarboxylate transporter substrate-binding protein [Deinococcales bacterium]
PLLTELGFVSGTIRAQNMSGAGGAIAFAHVVNNHADNEGLLVAASTATTSRIAAGEFGDFSVEDVRWPAALGADDGVLAVAADSPLNSLEDLVAAWEENPRDISIVGGSSAGGWDHLKVLLIADAADVPVNDVRYTSFSSGNVAIVEILAGRADVFTGDLSEALPHFESGDLKGIALLSDSRLDHEATADVPTGVEQGYDIVAPNWRGFYLPGDISDEAYDFWVDAFETVADSDEWAELREQNGIGDFRRFGAEMEEFARKQVEDIQNLLEEIGAQ